MSNTYNGWANYETWNFMLHEREVLNDNMDILIEIGNTEYGQVYSMVDGYIDGILESMEMPQGFAGDAIGMAFAQVDLPEVTNALAETYEIKDDD